jgi:hypothetical protein
MIYIYGWVGPDVGYKKTYPIIGPLGEMAIRSGTYYATFLSA